jgi:hypothetical protein
VCGWFPERLAYSFMDRQGTLRDYALYVILVTDVATGKIVGWHPAPVGQTRKSGNGTQAMLMACDLCDKREVMEFVSDNHGALPVENQKNF